MTISTKKFSEFTSGGDLENNNVTVGLEASANTQFNNPWTFLPPGNTGDRPPIAPAMYNRLRLNTTFQEYEYYNSGTATWIQLSNTGTVAGPFVIYEADAGLPTAFNLGTLTTGLLKQTVALGVSTPAIALLDTDYYGPTMSGYMQAPAGVKDGTGAIVSANVAVLNAVNYLTFSNNATLNNPILGVNGTDANTGITIRAKGTSPVSFETTGSSPAYTFRSGTSMLHVTNFIMSNTIASRNVTWQDASGTVAYLADIPAGSPSALTRVDDTNITITLGGTPSTALLQAVSLTMGWTGTLGVGRGGLGQGATPSAGDIPYGGSSIYTPTSLTSILDASIGNTQGNILYRNASAWVVLPPGVNGQLLQSLGPAANIQWVTSSTVTPNALTKVDDTNVTLTLGGTPASALLQPVSLTLGWTGELSGTRGGTGVNNGSSTITIGGNVTYSGSFTFTGTLTGNTSVTFPTSGTLATTDNTIGTVTKQTFIANDTYTPTSGMKYCIIECWGGGGGGSGVANTAASFFSGGGGGGAGSYSRTVATAATIGVSKAVTIGTLGTGGTAGANNGVAGGDTSVGTICIAKGGSGGVGASLAGGAGGVAGTGDLTGTGQPGTGGGGMNVNFASIFVGAGGSTSIGGGGGSRSTPGTGNAGTGYGAGGGGGGSYNAGGAAAGGAGTAGFVMITEYI